MPATTRSGEKQLLIAVRDTLRTALSLTSDQCDIESDEQAASTAGKRYFCVMPNGITRGPRHSMSGGVRDQVFSVAVTCIVRIGNVPRDRRRGIFLEEFDSLGFSIDEVVDAIDWKYGVITAANADILTETSSTEGFIEPLVWMSTEAKPRHVDATIFSGTGSNAALARTVVFGGARRITYVT